MHTETTEYPPEWLKLKRLPTQCPRHLDHSSLIHCCGAYRVQGTIALEDRWEPSYEVKHRPTQDRQSYFQALAHENIHLKN